MRACGNDDTAITLIALVVASALMIYLGGWLGVGGVAVFLIYAICSETPKETTPLQRLKEGFKSGLGIILVILMVLLLNRLAGC